LLIDDGGVLKLGAIQTLTEDNSIQSLPPDGIIPVSMFAGEGAIAGKVYIIGAPLVPRPYVVVGFADYDSGLSTAGEWNQSPTRIVMFGPGIKLPGDELQTAGYQTGTHQGFGAGVVIPMDNSVPQIAEGVQVLSQQITPRSGMSVLEIEAQVMYGVDNLARKITAALFRQGITDARVAIWNEKPRDQLYLWHKEFAYNTVAQTYVVRIGLDASDNFGFNGTSGGGIYGGSANSFIYIVERQT
jgi:hypothetical protein